MSKSPDAFRTISEVADWLGVQAHVLRFWESRFSQIKPVKRAGGRRYYRPNDMRLLGGIKKLLHEDGITIKGVQRILREKGVAYVASLSPPLDKVSEPQAIDTQPVDETIVPFDPGAADPRLDHKPKPSNPTVGTGGVASVADPQDDRSTAPICGGIASRVWQETDFDAEALRRIAPIARDLRAWLNRVENQLAG
ncbi:transcriptional regulator, MerR family [Ruegeria lacuscaerulensis ITI-1157]|nr:transcriptional regulator, MerR family [Ruegeria lacuscaerulensis ITI-1157]SHJ14573.1 MerR HTH family regulatory protein [Ruegeria lacuscaerulensis ITI-1157]